VILHFRLGPMSCEATEHSLRLFATQVAPEFQGQAVGTAPQIAPA
jgi:hypothetical protein